MSTVIDVDGTIIDTRLRLHGIWKELLGIEVPTDDLDVYSHSSVFERYASDHQKQSARQFQKRFWELILCEDDIGVRVAQLDQPMPHASAVVTKWSTETSIIYLTGRPETTRTLTEDQLKRFHFPLEQSLLIMYKNTDYARAKGEPSEVSLASVRGRLFATLVRRHDVVRVIDDKPANFGIYREHAVPEMIGIRISRRFSAEDYLDQGATRVVDSWSELM